MNRKTFLMLILFSAVAGSYSLVETNRAIAEGFALAEYEERLIDLENSVEEHRSYYFQEALGKLEQKTAEEGYLSLGTPRYISPTAVVASR